MSIYIKRGFERKEAEAKSLRGETKQQVTLFQGRMYDTP